LVMSNGEMTLKEQAREYRQVLREHLDTLEARLQALEAEQDQPTDATVVEIRELEVDTCGGWYEATIPAIGNYAYVGAGLTVQEAYDNLMACKREIEAEPPYTGHAAASTMKVNVRWGG